MFHCLIWHVLAMQSVMRYLKAIKHADKLKLNLSNLFLAKKTGQKASLQLSKRRRWRWLN